MVRPSWDEYGIEIAKAVSLRADCTRSRVGAILMDDLTHRIIGTGYNGTIPGQPGCLQGTCPRGKLTYGQLPPGGNYSNCIAKHAELNCLEYAQRYFAAFDGCTMYVTREPCDECLPYLAAAGVGKIVYPPSGPNLMAIYPGDLK